MTPLVNGQKWIMWINLWKTLHNAHKLRVNSRKFDRHGLFSHNTSAFIRIYLKVFSTAAIPVRNTAVPAYLKPQKEKRCERSALPAELYPQISAARLLYSGSCPFVKYESQSHPCEGMRSSSGISEEGRNVQAFLFDTALDSAGIVHAS